MKDGGLFLWEKYLYNIAGIHILPLNKYENEFKESIIYYSGDGTLRT